MPTNAVTLDDFTDGIMAGLALEGPQEFTFQHMTGRLVEAFKILAQQPVSACQIRFHLESTPFSQASRSSQVALERAVNRGVLSREHDCMTVLLSPMEAEKVLRKLPLGPTFWKQLAVKCR